MLLLIVARCLWQNGSDRGDNTNSPEFPPFDYSK